MRCTDCCYSKETIPEQLRYVYCTRFKKEVSVTNEFSSCQYEEFLIKAMRWYAKVTTYCEDNIVNCHECEYHGFCADPYSDEKIGEMREWLTQSAALIEEMQSKLNTYRATGFTPKRCAEGEIALVKEAQK